MFLRTATALSVSLSRARTRLSPAAGQGTVEYVGLILLIAGVLAAVVAAVGSFGPADIGKTIVKHLHDAIDQAAGGS
jgi:hypothetical protein